MSDTELALRFWQRVDKRGPDECWPWTGPSATAGYGRCYRLGGHLAHRAAFELAVGSIPAGAVICHRCDNPPCCNPAHLYAGTHGDNARDRKARHRGTSLLGSANPAARLRECDVVEIRRLHAAGAVQRSIADTFGVSLLTVNRIVNRRTWTWLEEDAA